MIEKTHWLIISPEGMTLSSRDNGNLLLSLNYPEEETGIAPHLQLAMQMTPSEARQFAQALAQAADEVEARTKRQ